MFYKNQSEKSKVMYKRFLNAAAFIGYLNSPSSKKPLIDSRISEEIFCRSFQAKDIGRKDIAIDAHKPNNGIGIKTFIGGAQQKIAQFKSAKKYPIPTEPLQIVKAISRYRNARLREAINQYNLDRLVYHSIYRTENQEIFIFEQSMNKIDVKNTKVIKIKDKNIIKYEDGEHNYSYNISDSQLSLRFDLTCPVDSFIHTQNKADLDYYINNIVNKPKAKQPVDSVVLKLYSSRLNEVAEKRGLNQSFADGRARHHDEVYIPIPKAVHNAKPDFFPPRHKTFILKTNDNQKFPAKVCQDNNKSLMSNPNKSLGKWILREQLKLPKGKKVTLRHLRQMKIDSVLIEKLDISNYKISSQFNFYKSKSMKKYDN